MNPTTLLAFLLNTSGLATSMLGSMLDSSAALSELKAMDFTYRFWKDDIIQHV